MKLNLRPWLLAICLLASTTLLTGCALLLLGGAAAAGAGAVVYVNGELKDTENVTLDRAWRAALAAMDDLEFKVTKQEKDALSGQLTARTAEDRRIIVALKRQSDGVTEFHIRVGTWGDENVSRLILDKIKKRL